MRNQRNFRGQSGRPSKLPSGGGEKVMTRDINCCCEMSETDDVTGNVNTYYQFCVGTTTLGVADCTCCDRLSPKGGNAMTSGLFGG